MDNKLSWRELKALNDLYTLGQSKAKIQQHPYIKYLMTKGLLDQKFGYSKVLISIGGFRMFYENNFLHKYLNYKLFLAENDIETDARKTFLEEDIRTLMFIKENKDELHAKLTNIEDFSSKIFDYGGSKYMKNRPCLKNAVYKILAIKEFPSEQKEHQWRLVVDCQEPKVIVLCENKSFLKQPWIAKENDLKLWYVGGNNIRIIDDIDQIEFTKPFYYSCDWDLAGLQIYSRIKAKLVLRDKSIELLYPNEPHKPLPVDSPYHKSKWESEKLFSGLNIADFKTKEIELIKYLISIDRWIEEESNDLVQMLESK